LPYISKADRERARWMTLAEAVRHVEIHDLVTSEQALKQIRDALSDGVVMPLWADMRPPVWGSTGPMRPPDDLPPRRGAFWKAAKLDRDGGSVFDDDGVTEEGLKLGVARWRPLLLLRFSVERIWPKLRRSTTRAEHECRQWLVRDLKSRGVKEVSKADRRQHAFTTFGIRRRRFDDRIWPEALEELEPELRGKASEAGRKRKSTQENRRTK